MRRKHSTYVMDGWNKKKRTRKPDEKILHKVGCRVWTLSSKIRFISTLLAVDQKSDNDPSHSRE